MNYGFVIDNRLCIGCHACSTACKSENEVPLGVHRTWVKYVDAGVFPDTTRHFQVTRCNHCAEPPCVDICPVTAMFQREDGIVDFDSNLCIGCKACMQACPYDAIYIDPESFTAAKCNYCAHRTEIGLEPACVVVCPEQAIISGDIDDPQSSIRQLIDNNRTKVRKPESGTKPNLFYVEGSNWTLDPTITSEVPVTYMWADVEDKPENINRKTLGRSYATKKFGGGPIKTGGKVAEHMVQVAYDVGHKKAWHWPVAAYMTSKAIASGVYLMLCSAVVSGFIALGGAWTMVLETVIVSAMIATGVLLCVDLARPDRFLSVIIRPQWRSWLARGAYLIVGFGGMVSLLLVINVGAMMNVRVLQSAQMYLDQSNVSLVVSLFTIPLAVGVAVYTAFLFRQAKGREMWQKKYLPLHMGVQALIAGASICILMNCVFERLDNLYRLSVFALVIGLVISGVIICVGHIFDRTKVKGVRIANQQLLNGKYRYWFWIGGVALGHLAPIMVAFSRSDLVGAISGLSAVCGLYCYEYAFVLCAQEVPNS